MGQPCIVFLNHFHSSIAFQINLKLALLIGPQAHVFRKESVLHVEVFRAVGALFHLELVEGHDAI
jgi:hypothetical protein